MTIFLSRDCVKCILEWVGQRQYIIFCLVSRLFKEQYLLCYPKFFTYKYLVEDFSLYKWLVIEQGCPINSISFNKVSSNADFNTLMWMRELSEEWTEQTFTNISKNGSLQMLKWARAQIPPCPCDEQFVYAAAEEGYVNILNWAHQLEELPINPWTHIVPTRAVQRGHFEVLKWSQKVGVLCPLHTVVFSKAAAFGNIDIMNYLWKISCPYDEHLCSKAARNGHLHILKWARSQNPPIQWDEYTFINAVKYGDEEILNWLYLEKCPWNESTCEAAAKAGNLHLLKWLRNLKCQWDERTCSGASSSGNIKILKWARSQNPPCPWSTETCRLAAKYGYIEILRWSRMCEDPCPWDALVASSAAANGRIEVVKWLLSGAEPRCPFDQYLWKSALIGRHVDILIWLRENSFTPNDIMHV